MTRLRAPDGCPWDREQTAETLKRYFIEETYEVIEAIDSGSTDLLREELGDALLQIVFHAELAAEEGVFNIDDVIAGIVDKLIRRHPHVFGDVDVSRQRGGVAQLGADQARREHRERRRWRKSILDGIPAGLPALMRAMEVSKRVVKVGFEWERFEDVLAKLDEEVAELRAELHAPQPDTARGRRRDRRPAVHGWCRSPRWQQDRRRGGAARHAGALRPALPLHRGGARATLARRYRDDARRDGRAVDAGEAVAAAFFEVK